MQFATEELADELTGEQRVQVILDLLPQVRLIARRIHHFLPAQLKID